MTITTTVAWCRERVGATFIQTLRPIDLASTPGNRLLEHPLAALRLEPVLTLTLLLTQPNNYSAALEKPAKRRGPRRSSKRSIDPDKTRKPLDRHYPAEVEDPAAQLL